MTNLETQVEFDNEPTFVCEMTAFTPAQREQHGKNTKYLLEMLQNIREEPDGYALELPLEEFTLESAFQFIALERLCCPFFGFSIKLEPQAQSFQLLISGPEGIKPFIQAEFGGYITEGWA